METIGKEKNATGIITSFYGVRLSLRGTNSAETSLISIDDLAKGYQTSSHEFVTPHHC